MLRLDEIIKIYQAAGNDVTALKGISLCFRKNEFVSILGPSGCGKTTMLNIIGGLDHYTSGDLKIDGRSTKEFGDRDWDVYRNHRIGFIFQSYNLIPHQTILENVELALTIAGIGKKEREEKAKTALKRVGLEKYYKKMPNQLSGGQCQRVAIARALVNEPDILLADEPTGALDSETSVQIMDLIREISKEKLVIMVTHNPELAKRYSTRIISLLDGLVVGDTDPFTFEQEDAELAKHGTKTDDELRKEKAKMSWRQAFRLSGKNLISKMKRTSLVVVASSIGIVGVSAVLAVSDGVRGYIRSMQDDMLSGNPVAINETAIDLEALMNTATSAQREEIAKGSWKDGKIDIDFVVKQLIESANSMSGSLISNNITEDYVTFLDNMPDDFYATLAKIYKIRPGNNIYTDVTLDTKEGESDPVLESTYNWSLSAIASACQSILGQTKYGAYSSLIGNLRNQFVQGVDDEKYVLSQYDIVTGHFPTEANEVMLVLNKNDQISDFVVTLLGYYSQRDFMNIVYKYTDDPKYDDERFQRRKEIPFEEFLGKTFTYFPNDTIYTKTMLPNTPFTYAKEKDPSWTNGYDMKISAILAPKENIRYGCLSTGVYYTHKFAAKYLKDNLASELSNYIRDNRGEGVQESQAALTSSYSIISGTPIKMGIVYDLDVVYDNKKVNCSIPLGDTSNLSSLIGSMMGGGSGIKTISATLSLRNTGGFSLPSSVEIYPKSFDDKDLVTDYLKRWNADGDIELKLPDGTKKTIAKADRAEIKYSDNLAVVITLINGVIDMVTIALISFTALSLVVSTVMIAIITYVSVMERIKEIGVIRAMGGRKKDVAHLFTAETFMIGLASGIFGIAITYIFELIMNLTLGVSFKLGMIANLTPTNAIIIILVSIGLTLISGLIPSSSAAKKDPVVALRSE